MIEPSNVPDNLSMAMGNVYWKLLYQALEWSMKADYEENIPQKLLATRQIFKLASPFISNSSYFEQKINDVSKKVNYSIEKVSGRHPYPTTLLFPYRLQASIDMDSIQRDILTKLNEKNALIPSSNLSGFDDNIPPF